MNYQDAIARYRRLKRIDGWFSKEAALLLALLENVQKESGYTGDIFEIGVHHGKSAIFLHHFLTGDEQLRICDLFGNQSGNTSQSGAGSRRVFLKNWLAGTGNESPVIFEQSSGDLSSKVVGTSYRIFHVDGGHSFEEALSDLKLAAQCLSKGGLIILDDPFRSEWPGVIEAAIAFLKEFSHFSCLVVGFNKLFLVRQSDLESYGQVLDNPARRAEYGLGFPWAFKTMTFLGEDFRCLYKPTYLQNPSPKVRMYLLLKKLGLK